MAKRGPKAPKRLRKVWEKSAKKLGLYGYTTWTQCQLRGEIGRFKVRVSSPVRHSAYSPPVTDQLSFELTFPKPLPLHLSIRNEDGLTRFIRALGFQDIRVGDARFDGQIYVKSLEQERVVAFLTEPRRRAIVKLADGHDVVIITSKVIDVFHGEAIEHPDQIVVTVREMVALAKLLISQSEKEDREGRAASKTAAVKEARVEADADVEVIELDPGAGVHNEPPPDDDEAEDIEVDLADAWLLGGDALPTWMSEQGIRLEEEE